MAKDLWSAAVHLVLSRKVLSCLCDDGDAGLATLGANNGLRSLCAATPTAHEALCRTC
ncbi:hypothetical protein [Pseudomonas sp. HAR-UPW-AIA-41]|uniref:hypothetical protein n=1 Tax=Pseudomonas sp. HAR-UPW-AIA-41 TaxID=1985301 RepID=UPI001596EBA6|nr:hypothetical protein [Pseudomonas sp. HAR-UPW-AIA-41]